MKPKFDRAAIMKNAHKRYREGIKEGRDLSFSYCLRVAWAIARMKRGDPPKKKDEELFSQSRPHPGLTLSAGRGLNTTWRWA